MKNTTVQITDAGAGLYLTTDPDGLWARSTELDERVTVDWDAQGRVIGIEIAGSTAASGLRGLLEGLIGGGPAGMDGVLAEAGLILRPQEKAGRAARKTAPSRTRTTAR